METVVKSTAPTAVPHRPSQLVLGIRVSPSVAALLGDKLMLCVALTLTVIGLCGALAPIAAPYNSVQPVLASRLLGPGSFSPAGFHLLGTDELGRDILSRLVYGARVTLVVALSAVLLSGVFGSFMGFVAGYFGGWVDNVLMRVTDLMMAFPLLLLALVLLYVLGASMINVVIVLGTIRWPLFARMARSCTLSLREEEYVLAAQALGCRSTRVMLRHIMPNTLTALLAVTTVEVASNILTESTLSFLGMGVQPPNASWGLMLSAAQGYILVSPWLVAIPGLAIFVTVLCISLLGGWLRMLNDPCQRWRLLGWAG